MTFNELLDLLSIKIGQEPSDSRRRTQSVVLSACSPFVEVDRDSDFVNPTLRVAHKSIRDLLIQEPETLEYISPDCYKFFVKFREGNFEIGRRCMAYLSYNRYSDFEKLDLKDESADHGLLKYAAVFWHKHLYDAGGDHELFEEIRDFMRSPNFWTCIRVQSMCAPHMFAKLCHNTKTGSYRMQLPGSTSDKLDPANDYYAFALPGWIGDYNNHGDHLVWGYHMFVREWCEVLMKHPDMIQKYFSEILGPRNFWNTDQSRNNVKIRTAYGSDAILELLGSLHKTISTWDSSTPATSFKDEKLPDFDQYIHNVLKKHRGTWVLSRRCTVEQGEISATVYRFQQAVSPQEDQNDDSEEEDTDDETISPATHEPAIWFLSVNDAHQDFRWFHYVTKSGILQKSKPVFGQGMKWLMWPQDGSAIFMNDLETWKSSLVNLPTPKKEDHGNDEQILLISQGITLFHPMYDFSERF